jgi:hypothetical protein
MSSLPVTSQISLILESLEVRIMFFKRDLNLLNLLSKYMKDFCLDMTQTRAYRVFNKDSGCVEITCGVVFDETNDSQVEQYDIDIVDDKDAPCEAL